jgi:hypothetical protein
LHPGTEVRWTSSFGRCYRRCYGAWTCDGCRAERRAREVRRATPPIPLHRSRPARPLDEDTARELVERLFALAIPTAAVHLNDPDAVEVAERLLRGLVPDDVLEAYAEQAHEIAEALRRQREARYKWFPYEYSLLREDVVRAAELGREDGGAGARDLGAAWLVRRAAMARRDGTRVGHAYPWSPAQLAGMKRIYLAYAADEVQRSAPSFVGRARILLPIARALLTKPILVLPDEHAHRRHPDYLAETG